MTVPRHPTIAAATNAPNVIGINGAAAIEAINAAPINVATAPIAPSRHALKS